MEEIKCSLCRSLQVTIKFINYELNRIFCGVPKLGNNRVKVMFIIECQDCGNSDEERHHC